MDPKRRSDWAVILARGASTRMGRPKGLCHLPGDPLPFLSRILALYAGVGFPVAIVTTGELACLYRSILSGSAPPRPAARAQAAAWLLQPAGGGTAATVLAALAGLRSLATHLWLHPVDVPGVTAATLQELHRTSVAEPGSVLVPEHAGQPGHPVVMPVRPFTGLGGPPAHTAMRPWLLELTRPDPHQAAPLLVVPLTDPQIVMDYDDVDSLGTGERYGGDR